MPKTKTATRHAGKILELLKRQYPEANCTLDHFDAFQLAIATILSAQCTDKRVNMVTPGLFARYADARAFAEAPLEELEEAIKSTGFYHNKARHIQELCRILVERYDGTVPNDMDALVALPGIGRKTANVIMGNAFHVASGFVVDTHVLRLSRRLGLSSETTPEKVERDLVKLFPESEWIDTSHRLILLGRGYCNARKPDCENCFMKNECAKVL